MDFKTSGFAFLISLACLSGCISKSRLQESSFDTLITVELDTAIDPLTGLRPGEFISPEPVPKVFTTYDSIQEFNISDGIFKDGHIAIDTAIKMYFYGSDFYSEPVINDGEELIGVFPESNQNNLTFYRLDRVKFHFDTVMKYTYPPYIDEPDEKWPVFYLKGLSLKNVKGKLFPHNFIEPGSSLAIQLGDRNYNFVIEGKRDQLHYPDWAIPFVRNYRLVLTETSPERTTQEFLLSRKYMPFPNEGDGSSEFIHWAGDLNNDGFIDIISGDVAKVCSTYYLWIGEAQLKFKLATRFFVCGC